MSFNSYKPLRLIELFAGIGSQAKALKNIGVEFHHWYVCEWDKYAIQSYNAVHGTNFDVSDITKLKASDLNITDTEHYNYLLTYSFPCQDLSNAGKGAGMEKGSGTRSGLLWEVERLLNECMELPQVLLMENVPQVHGKKNINDFNKWIEFLESKGYSNYWKDLNAKDYGIPQSRNRCYMVSVLGGYKYEFPQAIPLTTCVFDYMHFREKDNLTNVFFNRYKMIKDSNASFMEFIEYIRSLPVKHSTVSTKDLNLYSFNEMNTVTMLNGISGTLTCRNIVNYNKKFWHEENLYRPSPRMCFRLMGFTDDDYDKVSIIVDDEELYKQAGNSIVVNVLMAIFKELFVPKKTRSEWLDELLGGG